MPGGEKGGRSDWLISLLLSYIERGLRSCARLQAGLAQDVEVLKWIAALLEETAGPTCERRQFFEQLSGELAGSGSARCRHMAKVMKAFTPGLFVDVPGARIASDNLDQERAFRLPKRHQRQLTGRAHTGVRIVRQGPTILPTLEAHLERREPFTARDLLPFRQTSLPSGQQQAEARYRLGRQARSKRLRPALLRSLYDRFRSSG
jgi:hypothetical protein